jgi:ribosome-associated protein
MTPEQLAILCARGADHRKGEEVVVLDLRGKSGIADFFVIASGTSEPHLKAIREEIEARARESGERPRGVDGFPMSQWVVIDFVDTVVHVFSRERRDFYALERLWGDASRLDWSAGA